MAEYYWCHGPSCHTYATQDRVRGPKGSKVLRTKKIKQRTENRWYSPNSIYNYFCSQNCISDFWNANAQRVIALAPRLEPLHTCIEDPKTEKHVSDYCDPDGTRHTWTTTKITKLDNVEQ